jgi:tetratricopeptide (TPR) repeat protein
MGNSMDELNVQAEVFSELIGLLLINKESLWQLRDDILNSDLSDPLESETIINKLIEFLSRYDEIFPENALLSLFLGHCYNVYSRLDNSEKLELEAIRYSKDAIQIFQSKMIDFNLAISQWYLGLLFYKKKDYRAGLSYLRQAAQLLFEIQENYRHRGPDDSLQIVRGLLSDVDDWIKEANPKDISMRNKSPENQESRKTGLFSMPQFGLKRGNSKSNVGNNAIQDQNQQSSKSPSVPEKTPFPEELEEFPNSKPSLNTRSPNINSASEIRANSPAPQDLNSTEIPSTNGGKDSFPNPEKYCPILNLIPYEQLKVFNEERENRSASNNGPKTNYITPPFPIYGYATAGPDGDAVLPPPLGLEYSSGIDEFSQVEFQSHTYKVYSLKDDDSQIPIIKNKRCGWLKVEGDSMTNAWPIPLQELDYVLFYENHNSNDHLGKIVVASLLDDTQIPRLVIKYLIKRKGRFFLRSESPSRYEDVEINRDYQIIGEVIAIAKPM